MNRMQLKNYYRPAIFAVTLITASLAPAAAQTKPWTSVGSAGTVDESDFGEIRFVQGEATQNTTVAIGTSTVVRYNVVATDDIGSGFVIPLLTVRYRTGDKTGRVIATLKRYNYDPGGAPSTVTTLDSANFPSTGGTYVTRFVTNCRAPLLDFAKNSYFIEVEMQKNGINGTPGLGVLKVSPANCIP